MSEILDSFFPLLIFSPFIHDVPSHIIIISSKQNEIFMNNNSLKKLTVRWEMGKRNRNEKETQTGCTLCMQVLGWCNK